MKIHFRNIVLVLIGLISLTNHVGAAQQPNIIVVMPDDAGYGDYACLGNPIIRTPVVGSFKEQRMELT